jgi:hypothetical protein
MRLIALFFSLLFALSAPAAPVGNPAFPQLIRKGLFTSPYMELTLRGGYEGDFVADGRMNQYKQGVGRVDEYTQDTNAGTATFTLWRCLDLYGRFGSSSTKADWRFTDQNGCVHRIKIETPTQFLWGIGARALYYQWRGLALGMGGEYSACPYRLSWISSDGSSVSPEGAQFHWTQWQIQLDFSYTIRLFTPYVGCKY